MAATESSCWRKFLARHWTRRFLRTWLGGSVFVGFAVLVVFFQNCSVDLASTTPGAASVSCAPDAEKLESFKPVLNDILQAKGYLPGTSKMACGECHAENSTNAARAVFTIYEGNVNSDTMMVVRNYCVVERLGHFIVDKVTAASGHGGGQYTASEIAEMVEFVDRNF